MKYFLDQHKNVHPMPKKGEDLTKALFKTQVEGLHVSTVFYPLTTHMNRMKMTPIINHLYLKP